jgi:glucose/arabinose dehydrogenase
MAAVVERVFPSPLPRRRYVSRGQRVRFYALLSVALVLGACTLLRGRGYVYAMRQKLWPAPATGALPKIAATFPADGATAVPTDVEIVANLKHARRGINAGSTHAAQVVLVRTGDQSVVPAALRLVEPYKLKLTPERPLDPGTNYTFYVGRGLKDSDARGVTPYAISFTTAAAATNEQVRFEHVRLEHAAGAGFTCVAMAPHGRTLIASSDDGRLFRVPIGADGALAEPSVSDVMAKKHGGPRLVSGFCFDPSSTAAAPILWVAHTFYGFENVPDWTGKISRVSGKDLEVVEDVVVNLPRSIRDHLTHQPAFGPDGALYFPQGSNSAYGAPDPGWGDRPERLLGASILRLDTARVTPGKPLDARTPDGGGAYDPFAPDAPLTIYAGGVRLAYDLVWTSGDELYVPVNGSSAGGNAPGNDALSDIPISEDDWLFRIAPGKYHGHPNPQQGHFILNGGNPTAGYDFAEVVQYPVGTRPDPKWVPAVHSFGKHASANGIIEYRANTFGGRLRGKLLVCRYNVPGDIAVLQIQGSKVTPLTTAIPGLGKLANPLDLTEDRSTGSLYVSEYGAQRITLLRPLEK